MFITTLLILSLFSFSHSLTLTLTTYRIAEVLVDTNNQYYSTTHKLMNAIEKLLQVGSTI